MPGFSSYDGFQLSKHLLYVTKAFYVRNINYMPEKLFRFSISSKFEEGCIKPNKQSTPRDPSRSNPPIYTGGMMLMFRESGKTGIAVRFPFLQC
ncbi:hypothetical protein CEXT_760851 [Caerostris extrusa]|uniref:Uncharacterized protein n=1 Tax=Caerostris extrusa TaxID=172846 RepID=A0AAV4XMI8_CAEEX|nr:hypothetical protein CEXT_760851 [Caerostris extrusa]